MVRMLRMSCSSGLAAGERATDVIEAVAALAQLAEEPRVPDHLDMDVGPNLFGSAWQRRHCWL